MDLEKNIQTTSEQDSLQSPDKNPKLDLGPNGSGDALKSPDFHMIPDLEYNENEIGELLEYFSKNTYYVGHNRQEPSSYINHVLKLMERDFVVMKIENEDGQLCPQYPEIIPIIVSARIQNNVRENRFETDAETIDITEYNNLFKCANLARCRQRFPVPVISFNGKFVCRSSTLASEPEICYRTGLANMPGFELLKSLKEFWWPTEGLTDSVENAESEFIRNPYEGNKKVQTVCDQVRWFDVKLLKLLRVENIVNIMVEKRKVKHGLYVSASEQVDSKRYNEFKLISLPYPGCEFFSEYHKSNLNPEGLKYKWDEPQNDVKLSVPGDKIDEAMPIPWKNYQDWDLVAITQNYLKYIIARLQGSTNGLLLHCISGWDRTPLFISLIRLSLWADNLVHPSLNEREMLYFTLAYDWYLFGHHFSNRLYKQEDILPFCFDFLRYITGDEFSVYYMLEKETKTEKPQRAPASANTNSADELIHKKKLQFSGGSASNLDLPLKERKSFDVLDLEQDPTCKVVIPPEIDDEEDEEEAMDTLEKDLSKACLSPSKSTRRRTSPISVSSGSSLRQRSESCSSTASDISWQLVTDSGSYEKNLIYKSPRQRKLETVRTLFNTIYQRTVKKNEYGPTSTWFVESKVSWTEFCSTLGFNANFNDSSESDNGGEEGKI